MTKEESLCLLDIMFRLTVLLFMYSNDLEASVYSELENIQADINGLYYQIEEGDKHD